MKLRLFVIVLFIMFIGQDIEAQKQNRQQIADSTYARIIGGTTSDLYQCDPEFMKIMDNFIHGDVYHFNDVLTDRQRELITLVVLTANQDMSGILEHTKAALNVGVPPVEIKEAIYQCAPYMGMSKAAMALDAVNFAFANVGISVPLEPQSTVTEDTRYNDGLEIQVKFFGEGMRNARFNAPEGQKHISDYLSAMCFGDFYTRKGLDLKDRELLTFCMLSALGGCEPQVKAHITGNLNAGNNKETLIAAITQALPFIGYPRTLNAIACINEICK